MAWFKRCGFEVYEEKMYQLTKENLRHILALTELGFSEILKHRAGEGRALRNKLDAIHTLSFNDSMDFILKKPEVLKSPIIFGEDRILIGFNADEIRKFMPQNYRKVAVRGNRP